MSIYALQNSYIFQQQKQQQIAKQQEKYQNSIADYNLQKVVKYYTQAINSAENANDAKYLAEALNGFLSQYGKSVQDVDGINNPHLTDPTAAGKAGGKVRGNAQDKEVIKDLSSEFGIDVKKSGTTKDWLEKAKNDERVRILDKNGQDITAEREGRIKKGDILEVKSEKHGLVKIAVGGDGEINGGDDKVISMGGKEAAQGIFHGLNEINNLPPQANQAAAGNPVFAGMINPLDSTNESETKTQNLFTEQEIKHMLAAILQNALMSAEQKEYDKKLQAHTS
jgi:hypothetical protein